MGYFSVTYLGVGSATPTLRHLPSSQVLNYRGRLMLIDCGEGTQLQLRRYGFSFAKITDIFISHLHGDHFLGLPGLLSTISLHDVGGTITVHTFREGADMLQMMVDFFCHDISFNLNFDIIDPAEPGIVLDDKHLTVRAFPLYHRLPCVGYMFSEKPKNRHINGEMARFHEVPHYMMQRIREGEDFMRPDGRVIPNQMLTTAADPSFSYAYCSDTAYNPQVAEDVHGATYLYHEATYADDAIASARKYMHSTASQAARIAAMADAGTLVLGHYSQRYDNERILVEEAEKIFPSVIASTEGMTIDIV